MSTPPVQAPVPAHGLYIGPNGVMCNLAQWPASSSQSDNGGTEWDPPPTATPISKIIPGPPPGPPPGPGPPTGPPPGAGARARGRSWSEADDPMPTRMAPLPMAMTRHHVLPPAIENALPLHVREGRREERRTERHAHQLRQTAAPKAAPRNFIAPSDLVGIAHRINLMLNEQPIVTSAHILAAPKAAPPICQTAAPKAATPKAPPPALTPEAHPLCRCVVEADPPRALRGGSNMTPGYNDSMRTLANNHLRSPPAYTSQTLSIKCAGCHDVGHLYLTIQPYFGVRPYMVFRCAKCEPTELSCEPTTEEDHLLEDPVYSGWIEHDPLAIDYRTDGIARIVCSNDGVVLRLAEAPLAMGRAEGGKSEAEREVEKMWANIWSNLGRHLLTPRFQGSNLEPEEDLEPEEEEECKPTFATFAHHFRKDEGIIFMQRKGSNEEWQNFYNPGCRVRELPWGRPPPKFKPRAAGTFTEMLADAWPMSEASMEFHYKWTTILPMSSYLVGSGGAAGSDGLACLSAVRSGSGGVVESVQLIVFPGGPGMSDTYETAWKFHGEHFWRITSPLLHGVTPLHGEHFMASPLGEQYFENCADKYYEKGVRLCPNCQSEIPFPLQGSSFASFPGHVLLDRRLWCKRCQEEERDNCYNQVAEATIKALSTTVVESSRRHLKIVKRLQAIGKIIKSLVGTPKWWMPGHAPWEDHPCGLSFDHQFLLASLQKEIEDQNVWFNKHLILPTTEHGYTTIDQMTLRNAYGDPGWLDLDTLERAIPADDKMEFIEPRTDSPEMSAMCEKRLRIMCLTPPRSHTIHQLHTDGQVSILQPAAY